MAGSGACQHPDLEPGGRRAVTGWKHSVAESARGWGLTSDRWFRDADRVTKPGARVRVPLDREPGEDWYEHESASRRKTIRIGYAAPGSDVFEVREQIKTLRLAGCDQILVEQADPMAATRPALTRALTIARDYVQDGSGRAVHVTAVELRRLARTSRELITLVSAAQPDGVQLEVLAGPLSGVHGSDGPTLTLFTVLAVAGQLDRDHGREKLMAGQRTAAAAGRRSGRPRVLDDALLAEARRLRTPGWACPRSPRGWSSLRERTPAAIRRSLPSTGLWLRLKLRDSHRRLYDRCMRYAFFDLDDTLVNSKTALRAWSVDFAAEFVAGGQDAAEDVYEHVDAASSWPEFVATARARYGITAPDERLMEHVATVYPGKFVLDQRVVQGLAELRGAGWRLGVVTNGSTLVQQAKVDSVGLRPHVDVVVDSEGAGHRKPDRRIFEIAAGQLGVELGPRGWMVGDRLDKDVAGGAAAGLRTIWISSGEALEGMESLPAGVARPTHVAATIIEAFAIVRAA